MPENKQKISIGDYDAIMADRNIFNQIVYTPLSEALRLLDERQKDKKLMTKVKKLLKKGIPEQIKNHQKCAILLRQVATPNHEIRLFMSIAKENKLHPVICEYYDDKFTSNNGYKHSLGQLKIQKDFDCNGDDCSEKITIIDFNKYNGKKFRDILTLWGESLVDFHKKLFNNHFKDEIATVWNASDWYKNNGVNKNVFEHYKYLFLFFICNGILFENFPLKGEDSNFSEIVVLPTIEYIINITGVKPLIVPIEPIDLETENFWYHHLEKVKENIPRI